MKTALFILLSTCGCLCAADVTVTPGPTVTADDLQNLVACARMALSSLKPEQIAAVAVSIKHAEDDMDAMRKAKAVPITIDEPKKEKK